MVDETMATQHEVEFGFLEDVLREMGYGHLQLYERSDELPYPTLAVGLEPDPAGRDWNMALTFYPTDELDSVMLLQYYIQLPFELEPAGMERVAALLPSINRRLVLGHLGITEEEGAVHYRYVQALQSDELITRERVADVIKLVTFSPLLFEEMVEKLGTGVISIEEARAAVRARYER